jgi:hypothetical protein
VDAARVTVWSWANRVSRRVESFMGGRIEIEEEDDA